MDALCSTGKTGNRMPGWYMYMCSKKAMMIEHELNAEVAIDTCACAGKLRAHACQIKLQVNTCINNTLSWHGRRKVRCRDDPGGHWDFPKRGKTKEQHSGFIHLHVHAESFRDW